VKTQVVLEIEAGLSEDELPFVKQLLADAIGEFISARSGTCDQDTLDSAVAYVQKRYPEMGKCEQQRKADEVVLRKAIARKLRLAVFDGMRIDKL